MIGQSVVKGLRLKMAKQSGMILLLIMLSLMLLLGAFFMFRSRAAKTLGKDLPNIQTDMRMDNVGDVNTVANVADKIEQKTPLQKQLTEVVLTVSGVVYGNYRSGREVSLQGALVQISGITGGVVYSGANGEYTVTVTAYSDGDRFYIKVYSSMNGFHVADVCTWLRFGETSWIPGLQTVRNSVAVNIVLYELTGMVYSTIGGRAVDAAGNPVAQAVVTVSPNFEMTYTFTDADGYFTFNYAVPFGATEQAPTEALVTVNVYNYKLGYGMAEAAKTVKLGDSLNIPSVDVGTIILGS